MEMHHLGAGFNNLHARPRRLISIDRRHRADPVGPVDATNWQRPSHCLRYRSFTGSTEVVLEGRSTAGEGSFVTAFPFECSSNYVDSITDELNKEMD
jgi:hypothetical protein